MYPDQSLYPANSGPELARRINKTLERASQIEQSEGGVQRDWFAPIVADAEAGFGGALNCFEIMKAYIEAGAAGVHFEDQLAAEKKCGHLGGKAELGAMGYKFQFITLAGFHSVNFGMFELARNYKERGMTAYSELQQAEFDAEKNGYTAVRHQREVGTGYFDLVTMAVAGTPNDLQDRRVEITGPCDRKMVINALNSGAKTYMADFEDSTTPTWRNLIEGQKNLYDAIRGEISYQDPQSGKQYEVGSKPAVLMIRPRGWHLPELHVKVDGEPMSGSIFDFALYVFNNAKKLMENGTGPYLYLPKMENYHEAELWNEVLDAAEDYLKLPRGTIKDKIREATEGHDGTWVAHPGLVNVAAEAFNEVMGIKPNQVDRQRPDVNPSAADLIQFPTGERSEVGLRHNINVTLGYLESWLRGTGCVPLYNLMEDAATAEISRSQIWQWIHHEAKLNDGRSVDLRMVENVIKEEKTKWSAKAEKGNRLDDAADLLMKFVSDKNLKEFLTLDAYEKLVGEGH
ncbi:unnamed protein product [Rotaria sp. Silwood1]|nr:unnamed protein product [Rotaria sp. Silwood1]